MFVFGFGLATTPPHTEQMSVAARIGSRISLRNLKPLRSSQHNVSKHPSHEMLSNSFFPSKNVLDEAKDPSMVAQLVVVIMVKIRGQGQV
jgi:hypothetical protein